MTLTVNVMSYRYGHLAAHAIESLLYQTAKPDVIRFYDDGAGDCKHLPGLYPEIEFTLRPKNLGTVDNFNDALIRTTTERVVFLGADNWLVPKTIEKCLEREEDIVSYDAIKIGESTNEYWHLPGFPHGSAMYNVALAKQCGGYAATTNGSTRTEEDNVLFTKMLDSGATLHIIKEPLLMYRWRHRLNFNQ
jgi:hypothetical protein